LDRPFVWGVVYTYVKSGGDDTRSLDPGKLLSGKKKGKGRSLGKGRDWGTKKKGGISCLKHYGKGEKKRWSECAEWAGCKELRGKGGGVQPGVTDCGEEKKSRHFIGGGESFSPKERGLSKKGAAFLEEKKSPGLK